MNRHSQNCHCPVCCGEADDPFDEADPPAPPKRVIRGTTQASMPDGADHYVIEQWTGKRWIVVQPGPYKTKRQADVVGFNFYQLHQK